MTESVVNPLVQLLCDTSTSVQVCSSLIFILLDLSRFSFEEHQIIPSLKTFYSHAYIHVEVKWKRGVRFCLMLDKFGETLTNAMCSCS